MLLLTGFLVKHKSLVTPICCSFDFLLIHLLLGRLAFYVILIRISSKGLFRSYLTIVFNGEVRCIIADLLYLVSVIGHS